MPEAPFGLTPATTVSPDDLLVGGAQSGPQAGVSVRLLVSDIIGLDHTASVVHPAGLGAPLTLGEFMSVDSQAVATGTTQLTATTISAAHTYFISVAPGAGGVFRAELVGVIRTIYNLTAEDLWVWPEVGGQINTFGMNNPVIIPPRTSATFVRRPSLLWAVV